MNANKLHNPDQHIWQNIISKLLSRVNILIQEGGNKIVAVCLIYCNGEVND